VGDVLDGFDSEATSTIYKIDGNTLGVIDLDGQYVVSEVANGTTITSLAVRSGQSDIDVDNQWQAEAEAYRRSLIQTLSKHMP
jgi:hypothetical protein